LAKYMTSAVSGVEPRVMGLGPIEASKKAVKRAGIPLEDIDVIELNEAFASQSIACIRGLGLDRKKVNPNGGAIDLGHPLGASGAPTLSHLLYEIWRTGKTYGLARRCIGIGQGIAGIVENLGR